MRFASIGRRNKQAQDTVTDIDYQPGYPHYTGLGNNGYDLNCNLVEDRNYEMKMYYNSLNLPVYIYSPWDALDIYIGYYYSMDGTKLRRAVFDNEWDEQEITDYCGPFVYKTDVGARRLDCILFPGGRAVNIGTDSIPAWEWQYNLTDHLGSVRMVISGDSPNSVAVYRGNQKETCQPR